MSLFFMRSGVLSSFIYLYSLLDTADAGTVGKQAGAELCQAQLQFCYLGLATALNRRNQDSMI